jgi:hypothetical protein
LGQGPDGAPGLSLWGKGPKPALSLTMEQDGATVGIHVYDRSGKTRAGLIVGADGSPSLNLLDQSMEPRMIHTVGPDGNPSLKLRDAKGETLFEAPKPQGNK